MSEQRLSKLQKIILTVLSVMDSNDWETFYSKHQQQNKPPYWQQLRREYFDADGCGFKCSFEKGVKDNTQKVLERKMGIESIFEAMKKTATDEGYMNKYFEKGKYFDTPHNEEMKNRFNMPYQYGASSYSVSFSRAVKTLIGKRLIEAEFMKNHTRGETKKQISRLRLSVNNQNIDINNKGLIKP